jgi:hypothetical protein
MSNLSTLLFTLYSHPKKEKREYYKNKIICWINNKNPKYQFSEIQQVIKSENGTVIEPFWLDDIHLDAATILTQLAFTEYENVQQVKILSCDTYGIDTGGLFISNLLKTEYINNYFNKNKNDKLNKTWCINPWLFPSGKKYKMKSVLKIVDSGFKIEINNLNIDYLNWIDPNSLEHDLFMNSKIFPENITLNQAGFRVRLDTFGYNKLFLETINTDSMLKLSVYFMKNSYIVLDPGSSYPDKNYFVIRLEPAITETMKLFSTETFTKPGYNGWIKCNCNDEPRFRL